MKSLKYPSLCSSPVSMSLGTGHNMQSYSLIAILGFASATLVAGQQFEWYSYPWDILNLTQACFNAVNSSVSSCPSLLATHTTGFVLTTRRKPLKIYD